MRATRSQVALARRLQRRVDRYRQGRFLCAGPPAVREARAAGWVREVFLSDGLTEGLMYEFGPATWQSDVLCVFADAAIVAGLAGTRSAPGLVAVCQMHTTALTELYPAPATSGSPPTHAHPVAEWGVDIGLVGMRDPGNAGTIIRAAHAVGARSVLLLGETVDPFNEKCVRAAAGSVCHMPLAMVPQPMSVIVAARRAGWRILAAAAKGEDVRGCTPMLGRCRHLWLLGEEAHGLPAEIEQQADAVIALPMPGGTESLNAAMAATVLLYQSRFARDGRGHGQVGDEALRD